MNGIGNGLAILLSGWAAAAALIAVTAEVISHRRSLHWDNQLRRFQSPSP
ncbi:hypothetical protein [Nocardia sp. NRRL WC-3656]|nr:hypothetical protein [Nocardia sp. NRRL WC-3656]